MHLPFPQGEVIAEKISLTPKLCHLGGGVMGAKVSCSTYLLHCIPTWTSKAVLSVEDFSSQCCSGAPGLWQRGARIGSQASARTTAGTGVYLPISWCTDGWDSSWVPWHMVLDSTVPTETLLFLDGCRIFVVEWSTKIQEVSYATVMLTSLH